MKRILQFILLLAAALCLVRCTLHEDMWYDIEPAPTVRDTISVSLWDPALPDVPKTGN